jgi:cytochrome c
MNTIAKIGLTCVTAFGLTGVANAQEKITKAEAQALVKKITAYAKANGEEKAIVACNTPEFYVKGDGYIFAYDPSGVNVCHKNEKMRGRNLFEMKDIDGVQIIQEMLKACNSKQANGWIKYKWPNATNTGVDMKQSYAEKQGNICWASGYAL